MSLTMNKMFVSTIITGLVAVSFVISFEMETAFVKTGKSIRWTIKNLNELCYNYGTTCLESSPFFPFENSGEEWVIGLTISGTQLSDGPLMGIYIRSLDTRRTSDQFIDGTVAFKNSTNHTLSLKRINKFALAWEELSGKHAPDRISYIYTRVKLLEMLPDLSIPPGVNSSPIVMEKLNNILILEFSFNFVAPLTAFIN